ncbi:DNA primase, partial [termite gut metagenome]
MDTIKHISIKQYLQERSINPIIERGYYGMYCSPFRKDNHPSLKVDYHRNIWFDFGANEGGSIIDLVMKMEGCSLKEAATKLEKEYAGIDPDSFSFHRDNIKILFQVPVMNPACSFWKFSRLLIRHWLILSGNAR